MGSLRAPTRPYSSLEGPTKKYTKNMTDAIPKEQVEMLQSCFNTFDREKLGYLSPDQVGNVMTMMGFKFYSKELKQLIDEIDEDCSGQIEFEEFMVLCSRFMEEEPEDNTVVVQELREIFKLYDKEGVGFMTCDCLKGILAELDPTLSADDLDDIIDEVDEDGSNTIDFDEFCKMMVG